MFEEKVAGYRGSHAIKKAGVPINWTPELVEEYIKCSEDPIYFGQNHMTVIHPDRGRETITLYDYQRELVESFHNNRWTVAECSRRAGKTTSFCVFILWYILFNPDKTVVILANKGDTAREILGRIQMAYADLPKWLQHGVVEWNKGSFVLENGSKVVATNTSKTSIRGLEVSILVVDEAAFVENWTEFWASTYPTISFSKTSKCILVSTVNGLNHFWEITKLARAGKGQFNLISIPWTRVPGFDENWKQETLAAMNFNQEKFAQEYENRYLGSSGTLIAGWKLESMDPEIPLIPDNDSEHIKVWAKPSHNRHYCIVADVSRGRLLDYSTIHVIDITEMPYEQVLTYRDNLIGPGDFAEVINRVGRWYNNCPVLIEINDIGGQTADCLFFDYEYENVLLTESAGKLGKRIAAGFQQGKTDRGIRTTKTVKATGCSMLKLLVEQDQLLIKDAETIHELSTFSRKGNSYEAEEGKHDDLVMPLVLFAWLTNTEYFKGITDINTIIKLRELSDEQIMNDLIPFGFIDTGQSEQEVHDGILWNAVNDGFYGS